MSHWITPISVCLVVAVFYFFFGWGVGVRYYKKNIINKNRGNGYCEKIEGKFSIIMMIVEDQMNYLARAGYNFDKKEGISLRDNLFNIINCKLNIHEDKVSNLYPNNIRDWFAFYGGEELGISLEHASIVWDAAIKSMKSKYTNQLQDKIYDLTRRIHAAVENSDGSFSRLDIARELEDLLLKLKEK